MASLSRKTYDTDVITLRRIFAYNPDTNAPISSGTILAVTGARGAASFIDPLQISSLRDISTIIGGETFENISTGNIQVSSITFLDGANNSPQRMIVSSSVLYLNGSTIMGSGNVLTGQLVSSIIGLGTAGYISSFSTNLMSTGSLKSGDVNTSTVNFIDTANGSLRTLTASNDFLYFNGQVVNYANINFNTSSYIYQVSSVSTIYAFNTPIVVSTATNIFTNTAYYSSLTFSTGQVGASSLNFIDTTTGAQQLLAVNNGLLQLNGAAIIADLTSQELISTVTGLGTIGYVSSTQLISTTGGLVDNLFPPYFVSTVVGLGEAGYTSNTQLASTTSGLLTNLFPPLFTSTVIGLGSAGYISSSQLISSVRNTLVSTVTGLGTAGYISTSQLVSTTSNILTRNLNTIISVGNVYVSTPSLLSSLSNLYVPYSGNPANYFQLFANSDSLNFGYLSPFSGQIFVGDSILARDPASISSLITIEQGSNGTKRVADVLNILGAESQMLKIDQNLNLGVNVLQSEFLNDSNLDYTLVVNGELYASSCTVGQFVTASNFMITSTLILADSMTFSSFGPATSNIRLGLATGDAYKPTGATWKTLSDARIKENIVEADYSRCYNDVKKIPLRRYRYTSTFVEQAGVMDRTVLGFVAQELATVMPKSVTSQAIYGYDDLNTISVDQINMATVGALKKTIQDKEALESTARGLLTMNQGLVSQISDLQARMNRQAQEFEQEITRQRAQLLDSIVAHSEAASREVNQVQETFVANLSTLRGEMENMKNDLSMSHSIL